MHHFSLSIISSLSSSIAHACVKVFCKSNFQFNLFFLQPAKEWTPEKEISCQWEDPPVTSSNHWHHSEKANDTCQSSISQDLTEVVKLSEDLLCHSGPQGQLGVDKSDITRSASEILSVANSSLWQSTCQWLNIIDPAKVSLLVTCVLSTVRDRHFHILYTFFAPPQLESFKV